MKLKDHKNTKTQGNVGVGAAIAYATRRGLGVSIPLNDSQEYDLIFDIDSKLCKVQVKTTRHTSKYDVYVALLSTQGGNQTYHTRKKFDTTKIDYLFVLCGNGDQYFIPAKDVDTTSSISLGKKYAEFKL